VSELGDDAFCRWLTSEVGVAAIPLSAFYADGFDQHIAPLLLREEGRDARPRLSRGRAAPGLGARRRARHAFRAQTERRGTTLVLTISEPATRNTLSAQVIAAGIEALGVAEATRGALRRPAGRRAGTSAPAATCTGWSSGAPPARRRRRRMLDHLHHWIETMASYPKPIVAAVEGAAAGAGFSLALACDLIVAASDARFVMSHAKLGLSPDGGRDGATGRGACRRRSSSDAVARRAGRRARRCTSTAWWRWSACLAVRSATPSSSRIASRVAPAAVRA
jgi:hypothetical protein